MKPVRGDKTASRADLCYVTDDIPGLRRKRWGRGFTYFDAEGNRIQDEEIRERLQNLVIPPAWEEVWICPRPNGHLQATGRDEKGRKQYIYHPRWEEVRNRTKFEGLTDFGKALPRMREQVDAHMRKHTLSREKVLAVVVALLDETRLRVGNPEYQRQNRSYGLTTLRNRHVDVSGTTIHIEFRGKRGKQHRIDLRNRRLARQLKQCQELPGQELFQYLDDEGRRHPVHSDDLNAYLREISGEDFTAKDFRTWGGTVLMAEELHSVKENEAERNLPVRRQITGAVKRVAEALRNTPAICRKYYIHPKVMDAFEEGILDDAFRHAARQRGKITETLDEAERAVLWLLRREN